MRPSDVDRWQPRGPANEIPLGALYFIQAQALHQEVATMEIEMEIHADPVLDPALDPRLDFDISHLDAALAQQEDAVADAQTKLKMIQRGLCPWCSETDRRKIAAPQGMGSHVSKRHSAHQDEYRRLIGKDAGRDVGPEVKVRRRGRRDRAPRAVRAPAEVAFTETLDGLLEQLATLVNDVKTTIAAAGTEFARLATENRLLREETGTYRARMDRLRNEFNHLETGDRIAKINGVKTA